MDKFNKREIKLIRKLNTPAKIQDFLNKIPINFEKDGQDTVKSPLMVIRKNSAHCIEGAILGAFILSLRGHKPLLMHLESAPGRHKPPSPPLSAGVSGGGVF